MSGTIELKPSGVVLATKIIFIELIAALVYLVLIIVNTKYPGLVVSIEERASFEVMVFVSFLFARSLVILFLLLQWLNTSYVFTDDLLRKKTGVFGLAETNYALAQLESIDCYKSPLGTIFGFGNITIILRSSNKIITLPNVSNPQIAVEQIKHLVSELNRLGYYTQPEYSLADQRLGKKLI